MRQVPKLARTCRRVSRETVAQQILASPEAASLEVQSTYETVLNRAADTGGWQQAARSWQTAAARNN